MPSRANYQKLALVLALAAQFRVREPFVQNQSGTFCLQRLLIIIHSLMDVFKRIATSLDPSSVNENTRKLQYNIFVNCRGSVTVLRDRCRENQFTLTIYNSVNLRFFKI